MAFEQNLKAFKHVNWTNPNEHVHKKIESILDDEKQVYPLFEF